MWASARSTHEDEGGFAVLVAVMTTTLMLIFTVGMLATGVHLNTASVRDRSWNTALQAAEAGVDHAVYQLAKGTGWTGTGATPLDVPGGQVDVAVVHPAAGHATIYATGHSPSKIAPDAVSRRVRATYGPAGDLDAVLFSETSLSIKNNSSVQGSVFANDDVLVENNANVYGDITSATEGVIVSSNAVVHATGGVGGSVHSGGSGGIALDNGARVEGSAHARATACSGTPGSGYGITANGTVSGSATAWGSVSGSIIGTRTPGTCVLAAQFRSLPAYSWDPSLHTGEVEYSTAAAWLGYVSGNRTNMRGVHHVDVPDCSSNPSGATSVLRMPENLTITGDFTLVTNCRVELVGDVTVSAPTGSSVQLIVLNPTTATESPALDVQRSLSTTNLPSFLVLTTGLVDFKNNVKVNGAVYAASLLIKNSFELTYGNLIDDSVGFGAVKYRRTSWVECRPTTTGTAC